MFKSFSFEVNLAITIAMIGVSITLLITGNVSAAKTPLFFLGGWLGAELVKYWFRKYL